MNESKFPIIGICPECAKEGKKSDIAWIRGISQSTESSYSFGACRNPQCSFRCGVHNEKAVIRECPNCGNNLYAIVKNDEAHCLKCDHCNVWIPADEDFNVIIPPACPVCGQPLIHWFNPTTKLYVWACFSDKQFFESDQWAAILDAEIMTTPKPTTRKRITINIRSKKRQKSST